MFFLAEGHKVRRLQTSPKSNSLSKIWGALDRELPSLCFFVFVMNVGILTAGYFLLKLCSMDCNMIYKSGEDRERQVDGRKRGMKRLILE